MGVVRSEFRHKPAITKLVLLSKSEFSSSLWFGHYFIPNCGGFVLVIILGTHERILGYF